MELMMRVDVPDAEEGDRTEFEYLLNEIVLELEDWGYHPNSVLVLAKQEKLESDAEYGLSKFAGIYRIYHGVELIGSFFDEKLAREVYDKVKEGKNG